MSATSSRSEDCVRDTAVTVKTRDYPLINYNAAWNAAVYHFMSPSEETRIRFMPTGHMAGCYDEFERGLEPSRMLA